MGKTMTDHIRPEWARGEPMSNTRAEDRDDYLRDIEAARQQKRRAEAYSLIEACRAKVAVLLYDLDDSGADTLEYLDAALDALPEVE